MILTALVCLCKRKDRNKYVTNIFFLFHRCMWKSESKLSRQQIPECSSLPRQHQFQLTESRARANGYKTATKEILVGHEEVP